ncbi:MAG TPA: FixH family protein [Steroidobacteraceae bacterium]|nr:FixH family protein [Steroidobacteraceae bacterium]
MPQSRSPPRPVERPWHREPIVWLVITLPLLAVIGAVTSAVLAARGADPEVADQLGQPASAIHRDPVRDQPALRGKVEVELRTIDATLEARLSRPGADGAVKPATLIAVLTHTSGAGLDQRIDLEANAAGNYAARLPSLAPGHWSIEIFPPDRAWRLTGEFLDVPRTLTLRQGPGS